MSVSSVGGGGSSNNRANNDRESSKPKEAPKADKPEATQAQQQPSATTAKPSTPNKVAPNTVKPPKSDGFEAKANTSSQRNQQQAKLGSTTAPEQAEAPEHAQAGALEKMGLTAEDVVMAGSDAAPRAHRLRLPGLQPRWPGGTPPRCS
jgi:hypothetical protein